jgi:hypothetical protein
VLDRFVLALAVVAAVAAVVVIAARVIPYANDDTYIYFNYARNFVEGRPFAYDPRNIPSEGFSSALYLLLLVPFEAAGSNMMFAAVLLNLIGLALILYLGFCLVREDRVLETSYRGVWLGLFALFLAQDDHIPIIVGRGLETMLGPASILWAVFHVARVTATGDAAVRLRSLNLFFLAAFLSFLVRPENIALLGAVGGIALMALWQRGQLDALFVRLAGFAGVLIVYFAAKLLFFGDALQTGYYRKVHSDGSGVEYVAGALAYYWPWLLLLGVLVSLIVTVAYWRDRDWRTLANARPKPSLLALTLVAAGTLVVFLPSEPLIGYAYRYLVNFTISLYFLVAVAACHLLARLLPKGRPQIIGWSCAAVLTCAVVFTGRVAASTQESLGEIPARLRLYERAEESTDRHRYIRMGNFLRERIPDTEDMTFVFGDAGVLPYALGSKFIDANGLTEPFIARLFAEENGPEKARKFADYVLSWRPDVIVIAFGRADRRGNWTSVPNRHSPFRGPTPISVFQAYKDFGIGYVCTAHAYYDLHFGLRRESRHFAAAAGALQEYCRENGLVLANGLTVRLGGESVHFPRVSP